MKYAIIKDGKAIRSWNNFASAAKYFSKVKSGNTSLVRVPSVSKEIVTPTKSKAPLRNEGKPRRYRATTLERIAAIISRGKDTPKYALYARDDKGQVVTVAYTRTEKGAKYLRRKARGFTRRVLCRKYAFKVVKLSKALSKAVA